MIDAHVHIWTSDTNAYPLAAGYESSQLSPPDFTVEQLLGVCHSFGIDRINLVQMTWYGLDHSYLLDTIAKDPHRFAGTAVVPAVSDFLGPGVSETMLALAARGVRAFRLLGGSLRSSMRSDLRWLDHPGYDEMFSTAADHGLGLSFLLGPADLAEVDLMCARHPRTPVIIDHMGRVGFDGHLRSEEIDALCRLAKHERVMVKIGAFYALGAKKPPYLDLLPLIREVVNAFGPQRCMWESDCPFQVQPPHSYEASLALIRDHADFLRPSDRESILEKTAEGFFFPK